MTRGEKILHRFLYEPEKLGDIAPIIGLTNCIKLEPCVYCGGPGGTLEHVTPIILGGKRKNNLVGACAKCNNDRKAKPFLIWMIERRNNGSATS